MYREGIEVKKNTGAGILFEYPSSLEIIERLFTENYERVYYPNDEDYVVHIKLRGNKWYYEELKGLFNSAKMV